MGVWSATAEGGVRDEDTEGVPLSAVGTVIVAQVQRELAQGGELAGPTVSRAALGGRAQVCRGRRRGVRPVPRHCLLQLGHHVQQTTLGGILTLPRLGHEHLLSGHNKHNNYVSI